MKRESASTKNFSCPACGAQTMVGGDNVTALCPFCGNTMIDAIFAADEIPEVIIPFKISLDEAKAKLQEWLNANKGSKVAEAVGKSVENLTGFYLPFHIVRGACDGSMDIKLQSGEVRDYPFRAYLKHTVVNASSDINNTFLDGIEPFDFSQALEFNYGFLNHQSAKVQNVDEATLGGRVNEETREELYGTLSSQFGNKEVSVSLANDQSETLPALLPVYIVNCGEGVYAAVNGQTGKVAVDTGKDKNLTARWWIAPLVATLAVATAGCFGSIELGAVGGFVFGLVFFVVALTRHHDELVRDVITNPVEKKTHNDTETVFMADFGQGQVPAKLRFISTSRIIKIVVWSLVVIFLPLIIAVPLQLMRGAPLSGIKIGYGAVWYVFTGLIAIFAAGGLAKSMMYGLPLYYEIRPNGKLRRRKLPGQKGLPLKQALPNGKVDIEKKHACLIVGLLLFLLIGSVAAMLW